MHLTDYYPRNLTNKLASLFLPARDLSSRKRYCVIGAALALKKDSFAQFW